MKDSVREVLEEKLKDYQDRLNQMCNKCRNHEMCMGTGCEDKKTLQKLIDDYKNISETNSELFKELKDCNNELCLKCGYYRQSGMFACESCRWK